MTHIPIQAIGTYNTLWFWYMVSESHGCLFTEIYFLNILFQVTIYFQYVHDYFNAHLRCILCHYYTFYGRLRFIVFQLYMLSFLRSLYFYCTLSEMTTMKIINQSTNHVAGTIICCACPDVHRWPVNSPHKWPVTRKCFHLMTSSCLCNTLLLNRFMNHISIHPSLCKWQHKTHVFNHISST